MELKKKFLFILFFFMTQLMSIRFFFNFYFTKSNPEFFFIFYIIISLIVFLFLINSNFFKKIISNESLFFLILFIFTIFILYKYPLSLGTERDDCYIIILSNLANFNYPYSITSLGDPCSTGLSTLVFYFPSFFFKNFFSLTCTFSFLIFYLLLKKYFDYSLLIFFIYAQIFNLLYLEEAIAGSDFFLISVTYLIGIIYTNEYFKKRNLFNFSISFIFLFFFYGSRVPFLLILPINFIFFYILYNNIYVKKFFFILFFLTFSTIIIPAFINFENYHPFHILLKGYSILGLKLILSLLVFSLLVIVILFKSKNFLNKLIEIIKKYNLLLNLYIFILPLLFVVSITFFLRFTSGQISNWEGLSYLILIYPSLFFIFFNNFSYKNS